MRVPVFLKNRFVLSVIALAVIVGLVAVWWFFIRLPPESADTFTGEYELVLEDYDGEEVELSDFKRELMVVNTWASWCPYCGEELQNLQRLKDQYGDEIQILAVNRAEPYEDAKRFMDEWGVDRNKVKLLQDADDSFFTSIGGYAMPETIFINTRGEIVYHQRGPMKIDEVTAQVDALVGRAE